MTTFSAFLSRRLRCLNVPGALLIVLLQRTPAIRVAAAAGEFVLESPVGVVLRAAFAATVSLGTLHSLAGATQFVQSPANPIAGTVGLPLTVAFTIVGSPLPPTQFLINDILPPGLATIPALSGNLLRSGTGVITGTPTAAGIFTITVTGSDGVYTEDDTLIFQITGGTVVTPPTITTQPKSNIAASLADTVTFSISVTGSPTLSFQWRKNGTPIVGANGSALTLIDVQPADAGAYSVVVSNAVGSVTSNSATLTVGAGLAPPVITSQPASQTASSGASISFAVIATGAPAPTFQWQKNGVDIPGATNALLTFSNVQASDAGSYAAVVSNLAGSVTSLPATLTVGSSAGSLSISLQPVSQKIANNSTVAFTIVAANAGTYQWRRDGVFVAGATNATLVIRNATSADAGAYACTMTGGGSTLTSAAATLAFSNDPNFGHLLNVSVLTSVTAAVPDFSVGTVVGGSGTSGGKAILARAMGPSLAAFGLVNAIADPKIDLISGAITTATNDNWGGTAEIVNASTEVGAFAFSTPTSKDAAIFSASTPSGNYALKVTGVGGATGTVLAELYDATPTANFSATTPRLINLSVIKQIDAAEILTAGFVIGGNTSRTVLIRAVGPALGAFGLPGTMPDPQLALFNGSTKIAANDNWGGDAQLTSAGTAVGAFAIADPNSKDAMLLITLAPGNYSAQVSGVTTGGSTLVEVYEVP